MPRRIADFPDAFVPFNYIASIGSSISIVSSLLFLYILYNSFVSKTYAQTVTANITPFFFSTDFTRGVSRTASHLEWITDAPFQFHMFNNLPTS